MKRTRQSWATRKLPPLTLEEVERHLDLCARLMADAGRDAELVLPVYRRVLRERDRLRGDQALIQDALARLRPEPDRTAAQSS